jgi:hypothetical protein
MLLELLDFDPQRRLRFLLLLLPPAFWSSITVRRAAAWFSPPHSRTLFRVSPLLPSGRNSQLWNLPGIGHRSRKLVKQGAAVARIGGACRLLVHFLKENGSWFDLLRLIPNRRKSSRLLMSLQMQRSLAHTQLLLLLMHPMSTVKSSFRRSKILLPHQVHIGLWSVVRRRTFPNVHQQNSSWNLLVELQQPLPLNFSPLLLPPLLLALS